ncbi:MAG: hypothetical protein AB7Q16_15330 [Vicinamibacterales bacterium]
MRGRVTGARVLAGATAAGAAAGLGFLARTWFRYGRVGGRFADPLLDHFMPVCEVAERHEIRVAAPADVTYAAAMDLDLRRSRVVQAIFRTREVLLGARPASGPAPSRSFIEEMRDIGWGVLAEESGRAIVMGAYTQPWHADVTFHSLPPGEFAAFSEPGYVKILWTLVAEPRGPGSSIFRTDTRVATTDAEARRRFRPYWTVFAAGILLIRHRALALVKAEAERRRAAAARARAFSSSAP